MAEFIDRQALLRYLNDIWLTATPNDSMPDDDRHLAMARCMGLNDAMDAVKSIPAADVRPVVKARWVYTDMSRLVCSNCGNPVAFALKDDGWHHGDYCPNCGTRMEES